MNIGCCFVCVLAVLLNKVSLQIIVEGVTGGSVVLPCSSSEQIQKPEDIIVHWRHNDTEIVYDIINGKDTVEKQHQRYKSRAKSFSDEYERGNFSITLKNLNHDDAGKFECLISHSSETETVMIFISESPPKNPETSLLWLYIVLPVGMIIIVLCLLVFLFRKKIKTAFHPLRTDDTNGKKV